jgi:hypothetical protein
LACQDGGIKTSGELINYYLLPVISCLKFNTLSTWYFNFVLYESCG